MKDVFPHNKLYNKLSSSNIEKQQFAPIKNNKLSKLSICIDCNSGDDNYYDSTLYILVETENKNILKFGFRSTHNGNYYHKINVTHYTCNIVNDIETYIDIFNYCESL